MKLSDMPTYTVRYNARHRATGHLFGGRYKAVLVQPEEGGSAGDAEYITTLLDYIHLNPVRAGIVPVVAESLSSVRHWKDPENTNFHEWNELTRSFA